MPKSVLGIQLAPEGSVAVRLQGGWRSTSVERVIRVGPGGAEPVLPPADTVVSALPADAVFAREVELPFTERAKVLQAAPLEAEESLPLPLEELVCHVHVLGRQGRTSRVLVAAAPTARLEALLEHLAGLGPAPRVVDVEPLALAAVVRPALSEGEIAVAVDLAPGRCQAAWVDERGPLGFHALSGEPGDAQLVVEIGVLVERAGATRVFVSGTGASTADLDAWTGELGLPVEQLPFPSRTVGAPTDPDLAWPGWAIPLGLALREGTGRGGSKINLLQGPFAPEGGAENWRPVAVRAAVYGAILLGLWGAGVWSEMAYLRSQYDSLRESVRATFRQTLPEVTQIVSELDQMRARVAELEERAGSLGSLVDREVSPLRILRELSSRIPKDVELEFRDFTVEEGRVRVEGVTTSFDVIDRIRAYVAGFPRFSTVTVSDAKTMAERNKVLFKLTIDLGTGGG